LAQRLNEIPNGFPPTESGVELRLLAKIFRPQEAELAAVMRLSYEPAADIAARAGADPKQSRRTLKDMSRRGLIRVRRGKGKLLFALLPFVVGIYEEQLPRMDAELAALTDRYFSEVGGKIILDAAPSIHRVMPVQEAVSLDLEVYAHEQAAAIVESARAWGVRDCICRTQQRLIGKGCDYPLETCLILAPVEGAFVNDEATRPISKDEALQILRMSEEAGLVHTTGNFKDNHHYICNCCPCCCAVLRGLTEFDVPTAVASSGFVAAVDEAGCIGCGSCAERCHFGALSLADGVAVVDKARCLGCGICTSVCPTEAIRLERLPVAEIADVPANLQDWTMRRAHDRHIDIKVIL
jgi:ferredoxin